LTPLTSAGTAYGDNDYWLDGYTTSYTVSVKICSAIQAAGGASSATNLIATLKVNGVYLTESTYADTTFLADDVKTFSFTGIVDNQVPTHVRIRQEIEALGTNNDAVCI